jgi:hypothetical protein
MSAPYHVSQVHWHSYSYGVLYITSTRRAFGSLHSTCKLYYGYTTYRFLRLRDYHPSGYYGLG